MSWRLRASLRNDYRPIRHQKPVAPGIRRIGNPIRLHTFKKRLLLIEGACPKRSFASHTDSSFRLSSRLLPHLCFVTRSTPGAFPGGFPPPERKSRLQVSAPSTWHSALRTQHSERTLTLCPGFLLCRLTAIGGSAASVPPVLPLRPARPSRRPGRWRRRWLPGSVRRPAG